MQLMRAKLEVRKITSYGSPSDTCSPVTSEQIEFAAVCGTDPFGKDGESEDNTYARWTPTATLSMYITNPNLLGKITVGQKFYVDFTEAPADAALPPAETSCCGKSTPKPEHPGCGCTAL